MYLKTNPTNRISDRSHYKNAPGTQTQEPSTHWPFLEQLFVHESPEKTDWFARAGSMTASNIQSFSNAAGAFEHTSQ